MRKIIATLIALVTMLALATATLAAPPATAPGKNKIQCFDGASDGYAGTCTLNSKGAKGTATLSNPATGGYSGVYVLESNVYGRPITEITHLSFNYTGTPTAGSPRFSIALDEDGNGTFELYAGEEYAFASAFYCDDERLGVVDVINDPTCPIQYEGTTYANWDTLIARFPNAKLSSTHATFIIADDPGTWTVSNVTIGKPGK